MKKTCAFTALLGLIFFAVTTTSLAQQVVVKPEVQLSAASLKQVKKFEFSNETCFSGTNSCRVTINGEFLPKLQQTLSIRCIAVLATTDTALLRVFIASSKPSISSHIENPKRYTTWKDHLVVITGGTAVIEIPFPTPDSIPVTRNHPIQRSFVWWHDESVGVYAGWQLQEITVRYKVRDGDGFFSTGYERFQNPFVRISISSDVH